MPGGLVRGIIDRGACDLVLDLANPVPAMTTLHLAGMAVDDWAAFADPIHTYTYRRVDDPEGQAAALRVGALRRRIEDEVADRRRCSRGEADLISHLVAGSIEDRPLADDEVVSLVLMVIFGGIDTTTAAIGSVLLYLQRHPEARTLLAREPDRLALAIDELLRWAPPVQGFARTAMADCVVGGRDIVAGETAFLLWASANRDEATFTDPDEVVPDRSPNPHLTFGVGPHRCLGATVARAELRIVLSAVLELLPDFRIDESALTPPQTVGIVYGLEHLPATFTPSRGSVTDDRVIRSAE